MDDAAPRKAHTLREALNKLDPERPLNSKAALDAFCVARPDSPVDLLQILLEETEASVAGGGPKAENHRQ